MKYDLLIYDFDPKSRASEGGFVTTLEFDRPWPDMDLNTDFVRACLKRGRAVRIQAKTAHGLYFSAFVSEGPNGYTLQPKNRAAFNILFRRRRFSKRTFRQWIDAEFETLDADFQRLLRSRRRIPPDLLRRLASCRDCNRLDPESYMLKRSLWLKAVPTGRGCLCLACLAKRLGRPLTREDFTDPPDEA